MTDSSSCTSKNHLQRKGSVWRHPGGTKPPATFFVIIRRGLATFFRDGTTKTNVARGFIPRDHGQWVNFIRRATYRQSTVLPLSIRRECGVAMSRMTVFFTLEPFLLRTLYENAPDEKPISAKP
jgi:hypothetical protein